MNTTLPTTEIRPAISGKGGSITINGGIVCTELRTSGGAHTADSGIGSIAVSGGAAPLTVESAIRRGPQQGEKEPAGDSITINGGNVTAHGGINRYEKKPAAIRDSRKRDRPA